VVSVLLPEKWLPDFESLLRARPESLTAFLAEKALLEKLTGFSMYQGLLAIGQVPALPSLNELIESRRPRLFVAVDALTSAQNLGGIVRNCAAFGVQGLITGENCVSPFLRRAVRSSMGTLFHLPVLESRSLSATLKQLRENNIRLLAAHPGGSKTITLGQLSAD